MLRDTSNKLSLFRHSVEYRHRQQSGAELFTTLLGKSRLNLLKTSELIIVPDGALWYLPFEALSETGTAAGAPLIDRVPLRYAPTMSLASQQEISWRPTRHAGIVAGQLFPDDEQEVVNEAVSEIRDVVNGPVLLSNKLALPPHVVSSCLEELIVIVEGAVSSEKANRSPASGSVASTS